jgi:plasmid maintenance system antidote protein VapI
VSPGVTGILKARRSITPDTRCAWATGRSRQSWLDLQSQYDITLGEREDGLDIARRLQPANGA